MSSVISHEMRSGTHYGLRNSVGFHKCLTQCLDTSVPFWESAPVDHVSPELLILVANLSFVAR